MNKETTTSEASKARIKRVVKQKNEILLNLPQYAVIQKTSGKVYNPQKQTEQYIKTIILEWARGTGKSTILGWFIKEAVKQMPKATGIIVGETYAQILSRTLPSTKEGLAMVGLYEDIDYVVGKSGKALGFEMPFQAPSRSWDNVIHFSNGFIWILVSLDLPNAGRGINSSIVIGDEAALLDQERLFNNVQTTNRSTCGGLYENMPLCNAEIYASSVAMTQKGQWFTDMEKKALVEPWNVLFVKANAFANKQNLASDWFDRMKEKSPSQMHYDAEIMNIRPKKVANGFYPALDPKVHYYRDSFDNDYLTTLGTAAKKSKIESCRRDKDLMLGKPLTVTIDWGNIITMTVSQDQGERYRHLKTFFVKDNSIIDDIINDEFAPYYDYKKEFNNIIEFYFDRNGNNRQPNSRSTFAEQAIECFKAKGWKAIAKVRRGTENPPHNHKFIVLNYLLKNGGTNGLPLIEINENNCLDLIISLENAPAKEGKQPNTIEKDKKSERSKSLKQEHATHFSDTFDIPLYWKYYRKVDQLIKQQNERVFIPLYPGHKMK
jgi:hypothetical protein